MKTGTFLCWLFGHKFVGKFEEGLSISFRSTDHCVRCGVSKESS